MWPPKAWCCPEASGTETWPPYVVAFGGLVCQRHQCGRARGLYLSATSVLQSAAHMAGLLELLALPAWGFRVIMQPPLEDCMITSPVPPAAWL